MNADEHGCFYAVVAADLIMAREKHEQRKKIIQVFVGAASAANCSRLDTGFAAKAAPTHIHKIFSILGEPMT